MPLSPGTTLGPYQIDAPLGAGGMGEVYKATDTRLDRTVAIKVLPEHVAADPDLKQRFEREARTVAALNHPHICTLHDIGSQDGIDFLVMEYLDGQTLAQRLEKGALPLDRALEIAIDMADALDKAHRQGIVHRDLKPGNIMLTKAGAKLLDFGLAKLKPPEQAGGLSALPTQPGDLTQQGAILGTFQYMAPEQLEGGEADQRTDIFAFGAVVYEMVTGRKAFEGKSQASVIAAILEREPPSMSELEAMSPSLLDVIVKTCLAKDPDNRWHSLGDVGRQLSLIGSSTAATALGSPVVDTRSIRHQRLLPWFVTILATIATGVGVWAMMRPSPPSPTRFTIAVPADVEPGFPRLSSDGRTLAFQGFRDGVSQVFLRAFDELEEAPLRGAEGTAPLGFSLDGENLLVAETPSPDVVPLDSTVKRLPTSGGPAMKVVEGHAGAVWGGDDRIIIGGVQGLRLIRTSGGQPTQLTVAADGEVGHFMPSLLPGGESVLFFVLNALGAQIAAYDMRTGERTDLVSGTSPQFTPTGHLVFWRNESLWAAPFDPGRLEVTGDPVVVVEEVAGYSPANVGTYALSDNGTLVYLPTGHGRGSTLGVVDRNGEMTAPLVVGDGIAMPALSPDGTKVVYRRQSGTGGEHLWVRELERGAETPLTETGEFNRLPLWSPDGRTVTFLSRRAEGFRLYQRPGDLSGEARLYEPAALSHAAEAALLSPGSWTPDGLTLLYHAAGGNADVDIWMQRVGEDPVELVATGYREFAPRLSPNGRWLAYSSDRTGDIQVFAQAFPDGGAVVPVSTGPGREAVWSRDGQELFYRRGDQMWVVAVATGDGFRPGTPRLLFEAPYAHDTIGVGIPNYDVSIDGQNFLMVRSNPDSRAQGYVAVLNFFEELKARVPTN